MISRNVLSSVHLRICQLQQILHPHHIRGGETLSSTYSCLAVWEMADSWLCQVSSLCCWHWSRSDCGGSGPPHGGQGSALWLVGTGLPFSCSGLCPLWKKNRWHRLIIWEDIHTYIRMPYAMIYEFIHTLCPGWGWLALVCLRRCLEVIWVLGRCPGFARHEAEVHGHCRSKNTQTCGRLQTEFKMAASTIWSLYTSNQGYSLPYRDVNFNFSLLPKKGKINIYMHCAHFYLNRCFTTLCIPYNSWHSVSVCPFS